MIIRERTSLRLLALAAGVLMSAASCALAAEPMPPVLACKTNWLGNNYGIGGRGSGNWVQNQIFAIAVMPDGTVFANSPWDEGGREIGIYRNGEVLGQMAETHGNLGGFAIAASDKYVYAGLKNGLLRRYDHKGKPATWELNEDVRISQLNVTKESSGPWGIVLAGEKLYVSDPAGNQVKIFKTATMSAAGSFAVQGPGAMAASADGSLWIIQNEGLRRGKRIVHFSADGKAMPGEISDAGTPVSLAFDKQGRLLVADNGPRQQVLIYDVTGEPKQVGTFGEEGGVYKAKGEMAPLRFYGLTGVATDAKGNIYVACDGPSWSGSDLRVFSPDGKMLWQLQSAHFVDCADADPKSDTDVYGIEEHYVVDYSKPAGKGWTLKHFTLDPLKYPQDPRMNRKPNSVRMVNIQGKRFMYGSDMPGTANCVFRFDGEIAVPCVIIQCEAGATPNAPQTQRWLWRDLNADGSCQAEEFETISNDRDGIAGLPDSKGDIWQSLWSGKIRRWKCGGLDSNGVPVYSKDKIQEYDKPDGFSVTQVEYIPETDTLYMAGYTKEKPMEDGQFIPLGRVVAAYKNYQGKQSKPLWQTAIPYSAKPHLVGKSMSVAGDYVFVGYAGEPEMVAVIDGKGGKVIGRLVPGAEVGKTIGDLDIPYGLRAIKRANGEYVVFHEDDRYAKIVMYQWTPGK